MKVKFDNTTFHLTDSTVNALQIFMILYLKNIRDSKNFDKECWTWGVATINDFSSSSPIDFMWGGDDDAPARKFKNNEVYAHI